AANSAAPCGAAGSEVDQPTPVPRANAAMTTTTRPATFSVVETFCTQRPDATPVRLTPVNRTSRPTPSPCAAPSAAPTSRPTDTARPTVRAALAAVSMTAYPQQTPNPMRGPNAAGA